MIMCFLIFSLLLKFKFSGMNLWTCTLFWLLFGCQDFGRETDFQLGHVGMGVVPTAVRPRWCHWCQSQVKDAFDQGSWGTNGGPCRSQETHCHKNLWRDANGKIEAAVRQHGAIFGKDSWGCAGCWILLITGCYGERLFLHAKHVPGSKCRYLVLT